MNETSQTPILDNLRHALALVPDSRLPPDFAAAVHDARAAVAAYATLTPREKRAAQAAELGVEPLKGLQFALGDAGLLAAA